MTDGGRQQRMTVADRRRFLQVMAVAGLASSPATARSPEMAHPKPMPVHDALRAAGAGPVRPKIAMLAHPKMVMQNTVGPLTVFNLSERSR